MFLSQGVEQGWLKQVAPDLRFVVMIAGFQPRDDRFEQMVKRVNINIPSLHVFGESDDLVVNERSLELSNCFEQNLKQTFVHSGGHMVPTCSGQFKQILVDFIDDQQNQASKMSSSKS
eukprot:TRINITY_DN1321_c0_g1_i7.p6 TRINITY_DN1321_c0_g1~~TRINITY_DN1321_c0_g1_i7.p6  ORF type:complete len:118 (-),score=11.88 TRINITY_DN1321_c0_g1_i7:474-827(-)